MAKSKKPHPIFTDITITDIAAEGKAIAKVNDIVVFVPFVVPGDVVDLQVTRKKSHFMEARPIHFHSFSEKTYRSCMRTLWHLRRVQMADFALCRTNPIQTETGS